MSVVVIIPVYNRAATVLEAIAGVAEQTRRPDRLIVVDDGSTDGVAEHIERWTSRNRTRDFPVDLIRQPNRGAGAARNCGIHAAPDAQWYAFLDSDDLWPRDFLERTLAVLSASPDAVAATCDKRIVDVQRRQSTHIDTSALTADATRWLFVEGGAVASATVFRASLIRRLRGFAEHLPTGQDTELFLRLSRLGPWLHVPGDPICYRRGLARSRGESDHLRHQHADFAGQWARVREDFLQREGRHLAVQDPRYAIELARRWHRAAKQYFSLGDTRSARQCLRKAFRCRPSGQTIWRLARGYLRGAA